MKQKASPAEDKEEQKKEKEEEKKEEEKKVTSTEKVEFDKVKFGMLRKEMEKSVSPKEKELEKKVVKAPPQKEADTPSPDANTIVEKKLPERKKDVEPNVSEGYYAIQIASFPAHKDASDYIKSIKPLGLNPYIMDSFPTDKQSRWYRVGIGKYASWEAAEKVALTYVDKKWIKNYFIRKETPEKKAQ